VSVSWLIFTSIFLPGQGGGNAIPMRNLLASFILLDPNSIASVGIHKKTQLLHDSNQNITKQNNS